ncbi:ribonuclease HII [Candidatus Gottesmanbacteria bacterium]|nr:ribonuclease HII [Candidatus Gottesmanbacteria bacterium]
MPDLKYEKKYWKQGYQLVVGIDEVGRGAFAGPVAAAAAALRIQNSPRFTKIMHVHKYGESEKKKLDELIKYVLTFGIDDSKKLSPKRRKELAKVIKKYFCYGIGQASVAEINRLGIVKATERAMRRAIKQLIAQNPKSKIPSSKQIQNPNFQNPKQTAFVLVDAFHVKYIPGVGLKNQKGIIHGDSKSISIASASILAKVYRDNLMQKLSLKYRKYHWEENKGYGTEKHREAIKRYGITRHHRQKFVEKWRI